MGLFLKRDTRIDDSVKCQILMKPSISPPSCSFPNLTSRNLRFPLNWMDRFPFLSYTEVQGGGELCRYCVAFAQGEVGKGQHVTLGQLITKSSVTGKMPSNSLMNIPGTNFTWRQPRELRIPYWSSETRIKIFSRA